MTFPKDFQSPTYHPTNRRCYLYKPNKVSNRVRLVKKYGAKGQGGYHLNTYSGIHTCTTVEELNKKLSELTEYQYY